MLITDIDTGAMLSVKNGEISESTIIDIKIGKKGLPGELVGNFNNKKKVIGKIIKNTAFGIYGKTKKSITNPVYENPLPIAYQYSIKPGKATILTTVDDKGIQEFDIKILKVNRQANPDQKDWFLKLLIPDFWRKLAE